MAATSTRTTANRSASVAARRAAAAMSQPSKSNSKNNMASRTPLVKYHYLATHEVYKRCNKHQMPTHRQMSWTLVGSWSVSRHCKVETQTSRS
ncbi:hypothetical protein MTO96_000304 [Rhipicephalus appendiculatus]